MSPPASAAALNVIPRRRNREASSSRARLNHVPTVEVFAPTPSDLALNWVDWNPMPPDKNMGLWRDVYVTVTGPVKTVYIGGLPRQGEESLEAYYRRVLSICPGRRGI